MSNVDTVEYPNNSLSDRPLFALLLPVILGGSLAANGTTETITHLFSKPILEWGPLTVSVEFATEKDAEETRPGQIIIAFPLRPPRPLR